MKQYKKKREYSYAIGVYTTLELLRLKPDSVNRVLLNTRGGTNEGVGKIVQLCNRHQIKREYADGVIGKIANREDCYAVGVFTKYQSPIQKANHLVLVNPRDAGNMGTIMRTMVAYELQDLAIIRPAVDVFDPKVIRASMGALFRINFSYFDLFEHYTRAFSHHLYPFMTDGRKLLSGVNLSEPYSLIFGNEGAGLGREYAMVGTSVRIPQSSVVDSLNLSVAVGIALYEMSNKINLPGHPFT